jgi:hypothetical protein
MPAEDKLPVQGSTDFCGAQVCPELRVQVRKLKLRHNRHINRSFQPPSNTREGISCCTARWSFPQSQTFDNFVPLSLQQLSFDRRLPISRKSLSASLLSRPRRIYFAEAMAPQEGLHLESGRCCDSRTMFASRNPPRLSEALHCPLAQGRYIYRPYSRSPADFSSQAPKS